MITTWRKKITRRMEEIGETWEDVEYCTLSDKELDEPFDAGYGCEEGKPFTLWTSRHVYFPVQYDGAEWAGVVPRHPCDEAIEHVGGG
jgi:hypothetical protein